MDVDTSHDEFSTPADVNASKPELDSDSIDISKGDSSGGDTIRELENTGAILTRLELDIACACEKLVNLNILMMHVETRESDFEAFVSETEHNLRDLGQKALEFDLLSGILDSEVRELESFMSTLQLDIVNAREVLSSYKHLGEALMEMEDKLHDSEKSLEQSLEQISEIKDQSANFQRMLLRFSGEENWKEKKDAEFSENDDLPDLRDKIKMQTAEQQRHILRMLEKSLARELDFEKKVNESIQIEEDLELRLHSSEQEVLYVEEEAEVALERLFEADNSSELLMGVSKELLGHLRILEFKINGSVRREGELSIKLQDTIAQLKSKDGALLKLESSNREVDLSRIKEVEDKLAGAESQTTSLKDKVSLLERQLKESEIQLLNAKASEDGILKRENVIKDLKEKISEEEGRAEIAEAKHAEASDRVVSLEKELSDIKIHLQHAEASAEASQEKQNMLYSAIKDMENVIEDLKSKVLKAENQTESAEEKCIFLSESNSDLSEELSFLRGRVECLEISLHQAEETKKATAKDISLRTKSITDLIMQMAPERERLQKQISSLKMENKILIKRLKHTEKGPAVKINHDGKVSSKDCRLSEPDLTTLSATKENKEEGAEFSSTSFEPGKTRDATIMEPVDSTSNLETVRNIGAREFKFKYVFMIVLVLAIPVLGALLLQHHSSQV